MGKVFLIFLVGLAVSVVLAANGFNSTLLHGLIGAFMGVLTAPIIFGEKK